MKRNIFNKVLHSDRSLLFTVACSVIAISWIGIETRIALNDVFQNSEHNKILTECLNDIRHLDEVLTSSARLAANPGDQKWTEQYYFNEPKLDSAIKKAISIEPSDEAQKKLLMVDSANIKLMDLEHRALDLVKIGDQDAAVRLLNGIEYEQEKDKYAKGLTMFINILNQKNIERNTLLANRTNRNYYIFFIAVIMLLVVWIPLLRSRRNSRNELIKKNRLLEEEVQTRLQTDEKLQKINLAIHNSKEIVLLTDKEGVITYINPEFTNVYGYTYEEVVGKTTPRILKSSVLKRDEIKAFWDALLNKQTIPKVEYFNKCKDGKLIQIEGSASPIINNNGDIIGFLGMQRDITERKRKDLERHVFYEITEGIATSSNLDELLKLIHESLKKVIYAENFFIALFDPSTKLFSFPYWVDKFDPIPEPIAMKKSCSAYVFRTGKPFLLRQEIINQLEEQNEVELVGSPSPSWLGVPLKTPDRTIGVLVVQHYEEENIYSEYDSEFLNSVGNQIALAIDRKRSEEAIKREVNFSQESFDSLPALFYLFDNKGKFLRWNKRFEKATGYSAEEIANLSPLSLFEEPDKTSIAIKIQETFQMGEASVEAVLVSKDKTKTATFFTGKRFQFDGMECLVGMGIDISDRKQAEESLQKERLLLRTVIDNIPDSIYCKDVAGRKTLANATELRYSGVKSESDILGKTDFDFYPKELAEGFFADDQSVLQSGKPVLNREEYLIDETGQKHWLVTSKIPLVDEKGNVHGIVGIGHNITNRKLAEDALKDTEKFLKETQLIAQLGSYTLDIASGKWISSEILDGIMGIDSDYDRSVEGWESIIHHEWQKIMSDYFAKEVISQKKKFDKEYKIVRKNDGSERWVHGIGELKFNDDNQPVKMIGTIRDITEKKEAEEALRENEVKLNVILQSTADGILAIDSNGKVIKTNERFAQLWGIPQHIIDSGDDNALIDFVLEQLIDPAAFVSKVQALYNSKDVDLDILHFKDGRIFERYSAPLVLSDTSIGRVWSFRDITKQRLAEKEIIKRNEELSKTNAEKDKFFSIIAHDLKSPFQGLLGLSELMASGEDNLSKEEFIEYGKSMNESAFNIFKLIENLLEWAQMQKGAISFSPQELDLNDLVSQSVGTIKQRAAQKGITVLHEIPESLGVTADEKMLDTVLRNLISNSVKFTKSGGKIMVRAKQAGNDMVEISVSDTGVGMSEKNVARLFKMNEKVSSKGTAGESSTGLGLLLCREFVEKHGGRIWIESELGKGSTFTFSLPKIIVKQGRI